MRALRPQFILEQVGAATVRQFALLADATVHAFAERVRGVVDGGVILKAFELARMLFPPPSAA